MPVGSFGRHIQIADRCTAWKVVTLSDNPVLRSLHFQKTPYLVANLHVQVTQATLVLMFALWGIHLILALNR